MLKPQGLKGELKCKLENDDYSIIQNVNEIYLEQFKTEKGYKRMTDKRKLEFSDYVALDNVYQEELKELEYVLNDLETMQLEIIKNGTEEIATVTNTQIDIHKKYGGVVPEIASRSHIENITIVLDELFQRSKMNMKDIDIIGVTYGPGLIGSLSIV